MDEEKRPVFGNRYLNDKSQVFKHNAWDNVEWSDEQESKARKITSDQTANQMSESERKQYLVEAAAHWDEFYKKHENKFFKDRHWLFTEFPELLLSHNQELSINNGTITEQTRFMEIGCGAGNTIFPILKVNQHEQFFMYGCDYSETAVDIVKSHKDFDPKSVHVFVHDISEDKEFSIQEGSLDVVVMIFVLSALEFRKMRGSLQRIVRLLKPGGLILFRDYGRYDMAQLRFKHGRCISDNFYSRGDGTLVYFFTQDEVRQLFTGAGLVEEQNLVDRRLQVNRAKQTKMYRVWVQAKYRKP